MEKNNNSNASFCYFLRTVVHIYSYYMYLVPFQRLIKIFISYIDVDDVKYVINYDFPNSSEDYIHRIGRTGRSTQTGTSYAFFTRNNSRLARELVNVLREANQQINPKLAELAISGRY